MHILIVKLSSIGDVVHAMPAVAALRRAFPAARLTWVVERVAAPLVLDAPGLDEVVVLDTRRWRRRWRARETYVQLATCLTALRRRPVDAALDFQGLMKSAVVTWCSRAQRRIGFATEALRERLGRWAYTEQVPVERGEHVIRRNLRLAAALGAPVPETYEFLLPSLEVERERVAAQLAAHGVTGAFALLNPGGGWVTKRWPPANFGRLAEVLWMRHGLASVVSYGPGEEPLAQEVCATAQRAPIASFPTTLREYLALAQRAAVFVGGDTGPLHLAAAAGTPIVGLYGPTAAERNGPFSPHDRVVGLDLSCRMDCHRRTCRRHICMDISVAVVAEAVEARLRAAGVG
ncbi:MAG: lipopolysaccharide heptosyltransferase I [Chloracidobacterium sp.]|nr:lipopolysaccharide heptosyltransferase I [Chloracidobacterium sp.]MDW8218235.1 lipopolysaccharide heptosyltransferase I [Acidobacteriota bacterium]